MFDLSKLVPKPQSDEVVSVTIDGKVQSVPAEYSVLDACRSVGSYVPTMCYHGRLKPLGNCGACAVEVNGETAYSCCSKIGKDMVINTRTPSVRAKQAAALRSMKERQRARQVPELDTVDTEFDSALKWAATAVQTGSNAIKIDSSLCIDCGRCVSACSELQNMNILEITPKEGVRAKDGFNLDDTVCINCGQCTSMCPTGAVSEVSHIERIRQAKREGKVLVVQTAPAVRVALDELFELKGAEETPEARTGRMVAALREVGFEHVFDSQFTADLTIMEEGFELIGRLKQKWAGDTSVALPQFTSCCPAWITYVEKYAPQWIPYLSSAKSPMMMLGALIKTYFAEKVLNTDPSNVFSVAIMPCTAKKYECARDNNLSVDAVLTTRELAKLIKEERVPYYKLEASEFDHPLGESTGAAAIFGNSGGVMEAALRTAYEVISGSRLDKVELTALRGYKGIREATIPIAVGNETKNISVAICSGIKYAQEILKHPELKTKYDFIEVMSCQGGCICGGGQPLSLEPEIIPTRTQRMWDVDNKKTVRRSHENRSVKKLYEDFLGEPLSDKAHHLLHTHYVDRSNEVMTGGEEPLEDDMEVESDADPVFIAYATQTGNSKAIAFGLADEIKQRQGVCKVAQMDKISADDLKDKPIVLLITSTFGQGEFPDMALPLWESLQSASDGLMSEVRYAVFGLGSTAYPLFCKSAELFDQRMLALGAEPIIPMGYGDEKSPEGVYGGLGTFSDQLFEELGLTGDSVPTIPVPKFDIVLAPAAAKGIPPSGYKWGTLLVNEIITPPSNKNHCRNVEIDISATGLTYKTGYHIAILPRALDKDIAYFVREVLDLNPDTIIQVRGVGDNAPPNGADRPLTLLDLFAQYLDTAGRATKNFFKALIPFADDPKQQQRLQYLVSKDGAEEFTNHYVKECVSYMDVLAEFDSCRPYIGHLVSMIPPTKARLYSIASSHKMHPDRIQLTIAKVFWHTPAGKRRDGLTTNWLDNVKLNSKIAIAIKESPLVPPEDLAKPIIMAAQGCGLAPFKSFLQDREVELLQNKKNLGPIVLLFGCRRIDEDYIHGEELKRWEEMGLVRVVTAFSRMQAHKVYITHRLEENKEMLYDYLVTKEGGFYFCGGVRVDQQLKNIIIKTFMEVGNMTEEQAHRYIEIMESEGRFVLEAY